jgi:hypothetical protein
MLLWQEYRAAHEGQRTWAYTQYCSYTHHRHGLIVSDRRNQATSESA